MKTKILITGIGGGSVGRQILKALKLSHLSFFIYGCDVTDLTFGKNEVDTFIKVPYANNKDYINFVIKTCIRNNIKVLFPGSEKELQTISAHKERFEKEGIYVPINSKQLIDNCLNKITCTNFLLENGFKSPISLKIETLNDLKKINFFPVVLKPFSGAGGSANVMIAQNKKELELFSSYLLLNGINIMAQEYIGKPTEEYTVGVLCSSKGTLINSIVLNRHITSGLGYKLGVANKTKNKDLGDKLIISSGISQGEFIDRSFINEVCEEIALKLQATSTINIQGRVHKKEFYIFEINPRFSGTTSARAVVGFNEPSILIEEKLNNKKIVPFFKYQTGIVYRSLVENLIT